MLLARTWQIIEFFEQMPLILQDLAIGRGMIVTALSCLTKFRFTEHVFGVQH